MAAETPRTNKECEEEIEKLNALLTKTNTKLKRMQIELRTTKILNDDLTRNLVQVQDELVTTQTKLYTMSQKQQRVLDYTKWLDEYKNEASVSTKFINDNLP